MNLLRSLLIFVCLLTMSVGDVDAAPAPLRVMSFNVRLPVDSDGDDRWEMRRERLIGVIRDAAPDVIGTQELFAEQGDAIVAALPDYRWFGRGRRGGHAGDEHMGVFYRHERLRLIESGDFWLSDTPAVPGSISWNHLFPRMVTWALFERRDDARRFYLFNTHLPYRDEDEPARVRGVQAILDHVQTLPADVPVVLTGDFNAVPSGPEHALLAKTMLDAWTTADVRQGPARTFHAFTGKPDRRIDWILLRGLRSVCARTLTTNEAGRYPSDHFPVVVELAWPAPR